MNTMQILPRKPHPQLLQAVFERLALFHPLTEGAKNKFGKHCFEFNISKGDYLLMKGEYSYYFYFIVEGIICGEASSKDQKLTSFISVQGDFVSAIEGLYGVCPATESIKAEEDSLLLGLHVKDLADISANYPEINITMRNIMELHYKVAHHRSVFFRIGTASDKYAFFLNAFPHHVSRIPLKLIASFLNIKINTLKKIVGQQLPKHEELSKADIEKHMETEQPFRQKKLTLSALAAQFGIRPHTLSHLLNLYFNQNFNHFINTYRVNFVLSKLEDKECLKQYSLHGLGSEAGFSSSSSFFSEFKKIGGLTPKAYFKHQESSVCGLFKKVHQCTGEEVFR